MRNQVQLGMMFRKSRKWTFGKGRSHPPRKSVVATAYFNKLATAGEPWDIAFGLWSPSYIDPFAYLNLLFDRRFVGSTNFIRLSSASYDRQMRTAARLPQGSDRNNAYAALDVRLARDLAPIAAVDFLNEATLVSKRVGCIVLRPVLDLTAVCLR